VKQAPNSAESAAAKGETAIADWLRSIGGKVQLRDGHVNRGFAQIHLHYRRELDILSKLPQLEELSLRDTEISASAGASVSSALLKLDLGYTLLADSALGNLSGLTKLETLYLGSTPSKGPASRRSPALR